MQKNNKGEHAPLVWSVDVCQFEEQLKGEEASVSSEEVWVILECYVWEKKWFTECNNKTYLDWTLS